MGMNGYTAMEKILKQMPVVIGLVAISLIGIASAGVELTITPREVTVQPGEIATYTIEVKSITDVNESVNPIIKVVPQNTTVQLQDQFDVKIAVDPDCQNVYGVEYYLTYDTSMLKAETQNKGPFLGDYDETVVVINEIDHAKGIVSYAETRIDKDCTRKPGPGTLATTQFTAIGEANATSGLNLTGVIIVDCEDKKPSEYIIIKNSTVHIYENQPSVIDCAVSKHEKNNVQKKFECLAHLCVNVTDPDEEKGGNITYVRWSFGDGQYGTSEGGLPCNASGDNYCCICKNHSYISWNYNATPHLFGRDSIMVNYDPFNASVTVTDDGCPEQSTTEFFDVMVFLAGDANGDGKVNILDAVIIGTMWGHTAY